MTAPVSVSERHLHRLIHCYELSRKFSREQTRYLQEDCGSEIFLVPVSTTEEVSLIDLWIQNIYMSFSEVPGQMVQALSFQPIFGWSSQLFVERMTR